MFQHGGYAAGVVVSVCNISSRSMLYHFKFVDVVLGVGAPDCATVLQYGYDEKDVQLFLLIHC